MRVEQEQEQDREREEREREVRELFKKQVVEVQRRETEIERREKKLRKQEQELFRECEMQGSVDVLAGVEEATWESEMRRIEEDQTKQSETIFKQLFSEPPNPFYYYHYYYYSSFIVSWCYASVCVRIDIW